MKSLFVVFLLLFFSQFCDARDWYRMYLMSQITPHPKFLVYEYGPTQIRCGVGGIPPLDRPKAIFCMMEDYLTRKTKIWIKIGVK